MHDARHVERGLRELATLLSLSPANRYKARAYERGAEIVAAHASELGALIADGRLEQLAGVGKSLAAQIRALWEQGTSALLEAERSAHPPNAAELLALPGMTPRRLAVLHTTLAIDSLAGLREACVAERVRTLPGFGPKVEQKLLESLAAHDAPLPASPPRRVLGDALALAARVADTLRRRAPEASLLLAGAARRAEEVVAELELVLVDARGEVASALAALPGLVAEERAGVRQLRIEGLPLHLYPSDRAHAGARLLSATGPSEHVEQVARHAAQRGFALHPHALVDDRGAPVPTPDEAALYRVLDLAYMPPELRGAGEPLSRADADALRDLIDRDDIRGAVHCHTTHSDGRDDIEAMARAAEARGFQYITITDHSPSAHYARGVQLDRLKRQWDEIDAAQERVSIRILRGTESDILADGSLDYPDSVLSQLDVVIASIHSRFRMDERAMTARLVHAMELPVRKIWGHALGRLLLEREPFACDVDAVLDALARSGGAVEINGDPKRLDLAPRWLPHARARGLPFVLSVDAHSTTGLDVIDLAVKMARRGGLRRHEVLNALPCDAFLARIGARACSQPSLPSAS